MNRLAMGTVAVAALGILATGCNASATGSATPGNGGSTSTPASVAPADGVTPSQPSTGAGATTTTGTGTGVGAGTAKTTGTGTGTTTVPRCHSSGLTATVTGYDAGAGQRYARLVLQNTSGHACRMYGFPGLGLGN